MIEISVKTNTENVGRVFVKLNSKLTDLTVPLKQSAIYMLGSVMRNFEAQGRPRPWAPLSRMTLQLRRKGMSFGSPMILQDTGMLKNSISYELMDGNSVRVGTNMPYASKLQYGGKSVIPAHRERVKSHTRKMGSRSVMIKAFDRDVPRRTFTTPARPFVLFQTEDKVEVRKIFLDYLQRLPEEIR